MYKRQGILRLFAPAATESFLVGPQAKNREREARVNQQLRTQSPSFAFLEELRKALLKGEVDSAGAVTVAQIDTLLEGLRKALEADSITPESLTHLTGALTSVFEK